MNASSADKLTPPTPAVRAEKPYVVPRHPAPIDLKLDQNEGEAPTPDVLRRMLDLGPEILRRYPKASSLQALMEKRLGLRPGQVIMTAGADDSLDRICRAMLTPDRRLLMTNPSFEMIRRYAALMGAAVDEVVWINGAFPTEEFIAAATPETAVLAVVSPNNPTGTVATREDLFRIRKEVPQALLLLDHAYVEFADEDLTEYALSLPNTVVVRTFSKAWGLAGLRVGYAIGPEEIIGWLRIAGSPYSLSNTSVAMAAARIEADQGRSETFIAQVRQDRARLEMLLDELEIDHPVSQGNFIFPTTPRAIWLRDALAGLGISVRIYPNNPLMKNSIRISCPGDEADCLRVERGIRAAMKPEVIYLAPELNESLRGTRLQGLQEIVSGKGIDLKPFAGLAEEPSWLIGTGASDILAAREHQAIPLVLRTEDDGSSNDEFLKAGAARVLGNLEEIGELLS